MWMMFVFGMLFLRYSMNISRSLDFPLRRIPVTTLMSGVFMEFISFCKKFFLSSTFMGLLYNSYSAFSRKFQFCGIKTKIYSAFLRFFQFCGTVDFDVNDNAQADSNQLHFCGIRTSCNRTFQFVKSVL